MEEVKGVFYFFLGGNDLEMTEIKKVLVSMGIPHLDKNLGWGAHASAYAEEITSSAKRGEIPVLVELDNEFHSATEWNSEKNSVALPPNTVMIDHHGKRASEPAAILQVLKLLGLSPTRWQSLVAAHDSGGPPKLKLFGATPEEFEEICAASRAAQGITPKQETEAAIAIATSEKFGGLVVVKSPHSKCGPITDRLFPTWEDGKENVLILSEDGESNYFGDVRVRTALEERFGGWIGGDPLGNGFWGNGNVNQAEVLSLVKKLAQ